VSGCAVHLCQLRRVEESPLLGHQFVGGGGARGGGRGVVLVMRLLGAGGGGEVRQRVALRMRLLLRLVMRLRLALGCGGLLGHVRGGVCGQRPRVRRRTELTCAEARAGHFPLERLLTYQQTRQLLHHSLQRQSTRAGSK
jgi:hypothetical protein